MKLGVTDTVLDSYLGPDVRDKLDVSREIGRRLLREDGRLTFRS